MNPIKSKKGFTLIEIIVAIVLVGLVSGMAYSLLMFSNRMLANSNKHYDVQNDIRLASSYLTKELRFATDLEIISVAASETEIAGGVSGYNYFYIKNGIVNQAIYDEANSTYSIKPISRLIMGAESLFVASSNNVLSLTLTSNQDDKKFSISTEIVLENFPLISPDKKIGGNTDPFGDQAVKYKTKAPHSTFVPVTSITITGDTTITINDKTIDLDVIVFPDNASIKSVVWSSDDTSVASVDAAGVVTPQNDGTVIIKATAADGSGVFDTQTILVSGQTSTPSPTPTVTPEPTPSVTPSVTPTPAPTPLPPTQFIVSVVTGNTNTSNSFDVGFSRKVSSIQFVESNDPLISLTYDMGSKDENATLRLGGPVDDNDWIIVRFISNNGLIAVVKFIYSAPTTDWYIG